MTITDPSVPVRHPSWAELGRRARAWRAVHAVWSVVQLAALALVWRRVATRRRDRALWASVGLLVLEGSALVVGRGDCPAGRVQAAWGDPVPFFDLILPPRAARAAVPALAVVATAGILGLVVRAPTEGPRRRIVDRTALGRRRPRRRRPGQA